MKDPTMLHDAPIGIGATGKRHETDSMGGIDVPADRYWGAQTQRSLVHFSIGDDRMPKAVYHAYGYVKKAAALVNAAAGRLPQWKADAIARAADEAIAAAIAHKAHAENLTLKKAALQSGYIDEKQFDESVDPEKMIGDVAGS